MAYIGTVIHGTLRPEDLIPAFMRELTLILNQEDNSPDYDEILCFADGIEDYDSEDATEAVEDLINALNELAPPYTYFGAHEGDGSDFGWWPDLYSLEEDASTENGVIKVNDTSEIPVGWQGYVMLVNDHGNVTLLAPKIVYEEVWGVV